MWEKYHTYEDSARFFREVQWQKKGSIFPERYATIKYRSLDEGDIYVYYDEDVNRRYTVPRIVISAKNGAINYIKSLDEPFMDYRYFDREMIDVLKNKLEELNLDGRENYDFALLDMYVLTNIYEKYKTNEELNLEELTFLYEVNGKIRGFNTRNSDERINEILCKRDKRSDLATIFNCQKDEISIGSDELYNNDHILYHYGNLCITGITDTDNIKLPKKGIIGSLYLPSLLLVENFQFPQVRDNIYLNRATYLKNVTFPNELRGSIVLVNAKGLNKVVFPNRLASLCLNKEVIMNDVVLPEVITNDLVAKKAQEPITKQDDAPQKVLSIFDRFKQNKNAK